jgi:hypothetical protein
MSGGVTVMPSRRASFMRMTMRSEFAVSEVMLAARNSVGKCAFRYAVWYARYA